MTQEEKELLLVDLLARLPYGTIVSVTVGDIKYEAYIESISHNYIQVSPVSDSVFTAYTFYKISEIKPYLRSMSSMTEEEMEELLNIDKKRGLFSSRHLTWHIDGEIIDYLNKKMFDWRGLIPMGLANEAPEGMYNI